MIDTDHATTALDGILTPHSLENDALIDLSPENIAERMFWKAVSYLFGPDVVDRELGNVLLPELAWLTYCLRLGLRRWRCDLDLDVDDPARVGCRLTHSRRQIRSTGLSLTCRPGGPLA